jgi:hypothetical protein
LISLSAFKSLGSENNVVSMKMVAILIRTILINIKSFFTAFDSTTNTIFGWLNNPENILNEELRSDKRFKVKHL